MKKTVWIGLLIAILVLVFILYSSVFQFEFTNWDDNHFITNNDIIKEAMSWEHINNVFSQFFRSNYHPLTTLSYSLEYDLFGAEF